jgi:DNA-binding response OmpR family regulator
MVVDLIPQNEPEAFEIHNRNCILIIHSDQQELQRYSQSFSQQGFKVIQHSMGEYGLAACRHAHPDCVLADLRLFDMSGIELCRSVVDDAQTCGIPVILTGQIDSRADVVRARSAGCKFFLGTPHDPNVLLLLVNEAIAEARSWIVD